MWECPAAQAALLLPRPLGQEPLLLWPPAWLWVQHPKALGLLARSSPPSNPCPRFQKETASYSHSGSHSPATPLSRNLDHTVVLVACVCDCPCFLASRVFTGTNCAGTLRLSFVIRVSAPLVTAGPRRPYDFCGGKGCSFC